MGELHHLGDFHTLFPLEKWDRGCHGGKGGSTAWLMSSPGDSSCLVPFNRYEEEINRRTAAENEFVVLKKVSHRGTRREGVWGDRLQRHWKEAAPRRAASNGRHWLPTALLGWEEAVVYPCDLSFRMWTVPT